MRTIAFCRLAVAFLPTLAGPAALAQSPEGPTSTAFTYQGLIKLSGVPLDDTADFEFRLFDMDIGGSQIGQTATAGNVPVSEGLFSVPVGFGVDLPAGPPAFLEIAVRSPAGVGVFEVLSPRQPLTAAPFATTAARVALPLAQTMNVVGDAFSVTNDSAAPDGPEGGGSSAIKGKSDNGSAVFGDTRDGIGVFGRSRGNNGIAVKAFADGIRPALLATNAGPGGAAKFEFNRAQPNLQAAVEIATNTDGASLSIGNTGTGRGVSIALESSQNTSKALELFNLGTGDSVFVQHRGSGGRAADLLVNPLADPNTSEVLRARTESTGRAAVLEIDTLLSGANNTTEALLARTTSNGGAARFEATSLTGTGDALVALTRGKGGAVVIEAALQGVTNQPALRVSSMSTTQGVASFTQNSPLNNIDAVTILCNVLRHAFFVRQTGAGESAHFVNDPGNANNCVYIENEHPAGRALVVQNLLGTGSGAPPGLALQVNGQTELNGSVSVAAGLNVLSGELCAQTVCAAIKQFHIDHPLDPANRYMYHACVESNEYKTVYDGKVVLDERGQATVELPAWFEALNRDFRYQLTAIGEPGPNLHIARTIENNRFTIGGGNPSMEVCWQVTAVRHDAYAKAHPLRVEVDKPAEERGLYLNPMEHGQPPQRGVSFRAEESPGCGAEHEERE